METATSRSKWPLGVSADVGNLLYRNFKVVGAFVSNAHSRLRGRSHSGVAKARRLARLQLYLPEMLRI